MANPALSELETASTDLAHLVNALGWVWNMPGGVRLSIIGVEKDTLTLLIGTPVVLTPDEESAASTVLPPYTHNPTAKSD